MSIVSFATAIDIDVAADEVEETLAAAARHAPSTKTPAVRDALPPPPNVFRRRAAVARDPVAQFVPWIPVVVPLLGAMMAFNAYLIGWAVLLRP